MSDELVELRCPVERQRMFGKMRSLPRGSQIVAGNLVEFSCDRCSRSGEEGWRTVHRYDFTGELIETVKVKK